MKTHRICRTNATITWILSSFLFASPLLAASSPGLNSTSSEVAPFPDNLKNNIKHVIIIYLEGRSFDNLYGKFPGADGITQASDVSKKQLGQTGADSPTLFLPNTIRIPGVPDNQDSRFNNVVKLQTNVPYDLQEFIPNDQREGDMVQRFYHEQYQTNHPPGGFDPRNRDGGPMSKFAAWSDNPGLVMGIYDASNLKEGHLAKDFVLCDNAYHSAFGDSYLNHMWLIAARTPVWPANPMVGPPDVGSPPNPANATQFEPAQGNIQVPKTQSSPHLVNDLSDGVITNDNKLPGFPMSNNAKNLGAGDFWSVNGTFPLRGPAGGLNTIDPNPPPPGVTVQPQQKTFDVPLKDRLPLQTYETIGDRLDNAKPTITWAWYSQGWNDAKNGKANYLFQFQHQPFTYFANYALHSTPVPENGSSPAKPGTDSKGSGIHLKDLDADFFIALNNGTLPQVSFIKPIGQKSKHPGNASLKEGDDWLNDTVTKIQAKKEIWDNCVIFIMYDTNGGQWDHEAPPSIDNWGPGTRVPLIVISPFAKKNNFVDHTQYETVSLLAFIEKLYKLDPLNTRDKNALPPLSSFDGQPDLIVHAVVGQPFEYLLPAYNDPIKFTIDGDLGGGVEVAPGGVLSGTPKQKGSHSVKVTFNGSKEPLTYTYTLRLDADDKGN